jgi:type II restriction/modification system DNA methylase subunit YeeA
LSGFVQQQHTICNFSNEESWVILSPIEQSIKRKIESVGTPLKDWDIKIYRGVLTGYNDAFIISTEKRDEILSNCQTEDERLRTAELIRPILRGRDIKRYGYNWADLWLIATFPSRHYDIEDYPAVKNHLLLYGKERLEQTGKKYIINEEEIKARKKTSNKWFETQDSISYWEDFNKPKIVWKRVGSILRFCYNNNGALGLDSTCFATGNNIEFICCVLNSPMGHYLLKDAPKTGTGDLLISVQAVEPIKCIFRRIPVQHFR